MACPHCEHELSALRYAIGALRAELAVVTAERDAARGLLADRPRALDRALGRTCLMITGRSAAEAETRRYPAAPSHSDGGDDTIDDTIDTIVVDADVP